MKERGNHFLRFLDRFCGIPLVVFLSLLKKKRILPPFFKSAALLKTAGIGDVVLLTGVIQSLLEKEIKVTLFTGGANQEMGKLIDGITCIPLPVTKPLKALKMIRRFHFDIWIDCDPWPRINALFSALSRSTYSIGFQTKHQCRHRLYDCAIPHSFHCHEIDNYRKLLEPIGIQSTHLPKITIQETQSFKKYVVLHLFSGGSRAYLKSWPEKNWIQLIKWIRQQNLEVILTGSKKDQDSLNNYVIDQGIANLAGTLTLKETAHLLKNSAAVISVDTGIMHLAAALDCFVIGLHGPTSPSRWGAIGPQVISLTPSLEYTPCINLGFESTCKDNICMRAISAEQVIEMLQRYINALKSKNF